MSSQFIAIRVCLYKEVSEPNSKPSSLAVLQEDASILLQLDPTCDVPSTCSGPTSAVAVTCTESAQNTVVASATKVDTVTDKPANASEKSEKKARRVNTVLLAPM